MLRTKHPHVVEKCLAEFDGSVCFRRKGHPGKHVDGIGSRNGPLFWTDAGKQEVLKKRAVAGEDALVPENA